MIFETIETFNGSRKIKRLKTSIILLLGIFCLIFGIYLVKIGKIIGITFILFLFPCFIIYPVIRFFLFGGKDSIAGVVTTIVVEEVTKGIITSAIRKGNRKRKR